ncbi:hypothetical protein TSMEX_004610 [Taenia solium]|eukprot:TsM_000966500 transcript=TsM_000966500 gene=TsM_000966500
MEEDNYPVLLVDVGGLCNEVDLLCRPRNSECSSLTGGPKSCRCKPGFFPVYQQSLHYHECFKQVHCETKGSPEGHKSGICVDLNGDGMPDDSFCARNGSIQSNHSLHHGLSDSGERMSISYSHNWPTLDVILEKGSEINGIMEIGTRNSGAWDDSCRRPMGNVLIKSFSGLFSTTNKTAAPTTAPIIDRWQCDSLFDR